MKPTVVLMGSKPGSVVALRLMLERDWIVRYVVVTPNERHEWIVGPSLQEEAERLGLRIVTQEELPQDLRVDFVISYMFRKRVIPEVLDLASRAAVNFHAAPLPEFGGWAFYNVAILEQSEDYGCTCHHMDNGFDTGPILKVRRFKIDHKAHTAITLEHEAQREMIRLFMDFLELVESGESLPSIPQDKAKMRYLSKNEFVCLKEISHNANAETIDRHARAFWYPPYECAYVKVGELKAEVIPQCAKLEIARFSQEEALTDLMAVAENYKKSSEQI